MPLSVQLPHVRQAHTKYTLVSKAKVVLKSSFYIVCNTEFHAPSVISYGDKDPIKPIRV